MVRSSTLNNALANSQQQNFKTVNNLLTLQDNHVEEFLQYHGEAFLAALEQLMEDVIERVMSQMLSTLHFRLDAAQGDMILDKQCLSEYQRITQENIDLDIQKILGASVNQEVVYQRQMAKNQYLEAQGFSTDSGSMAGNQQPQMDGMQQQMGMQQQGQPANIQGQPQMGGMNQQMGMQQQAMGNQSGYPIAPNGYDQYNNPYWMDPATGQASYTPPTSGMGLTKMIQKGAAWAKWLA